MRWSGLSLTLWCNQGKSSHYLLFFPLVTVLVRAHDATTSLNAHSLNKSLVSDPEAQFGFARLCSIRNLKENCELIRSSFL